MKKMSILSLKKENSLSELVEAPCAPVGHAKLQEWYVLQKRLGS